MKVLIILGLFLIISCKASKIDTGTTTYKNFDPDKISKDAHAFISDSIDVKGHRYILLKYNH